MAQSEQSEVALQNIAVGDALALGLERVLRADHGGQVDALEQAPNQGRFIGKYLKRINFNALVDPAFPVRSGIANSDILKSYLGLLCLGKNDFDAIEVQRTDAFFARALHLRAVPSSPTPRQRMDTHGGTDGASGSGAPLLFRADSGFDSAKLMCAIDR